MREILWEVPLCIQGDNRKYWDWFYCKLNSWVREVSVVCQLILKWCKRDYSYCLASFSQSFVIHTIEWSSVLRLVRMFCEWKYGRTFIHQILSKGWENCHRNLPNFTISVWKWDMEAFVCFEWFKQFKEGRTSVESMNVKMYFNKL